MTKGARRVRDFGHLGLLTSQTLAGAMVGGGIQDTLRRSLSSRPASHPISSSSSQTPRFRWDGSGIIINSGNAWSESASSTSGIYHCTINLQIIGGLTSPDDWVGINCTIAATGDTAIDGNLSVAGDLAYDGTTNGLLFIVSMLGGAEVTVNITATATRIASL